MAELPDKRAAFMDWYLAVVDGANLTDKRYPVKGMNVWTAYGFRARRNLDAVLTREIEATGSEAVEFPTLIPATEFAKEKEHIKGFDAQVYWVTKGGLSELDVPLVLRPTSETAMYPIFALWVRSHRDLPLNVYQVVNTFRYETKTTRPFLRVREIHFFEEHTCQANEAHATARVESNLAAFRKMADAFALPYLPIRRPEWDKFPGAFYSIALDIPVGEARTLQIGSIHHYRENFSRPYGIRYEAADGSQPYVHQTTFGLSERLLGAILAVHGDQKGAVFPSAIAPYQVVVIPIPGTGAGEGPLRTATEIVDRLRLHGVRVRLDGGDERPGAKDLPGGSSPGPRFVSRSVGARRSRGARPRSTGSAGRATLPSTVSSTRSQSTWPSSTGPSSSAPGRRSSRRSPSRRRSRSSPVRRPSGWSPGAVRRSAAIGSRPQSMAPCSERPRGPCRSPWGNPARAWRAARERTFAGRSRADRCSCGVAPLRGRRRREGWVGQHEPHPREAEQ